MPIRAIIIRKQGSAYIKYELFKRLNTGGSLLSAQEIRNCSSRMVEGGAEFYKTIQSLASSARFKVTIERLPDTALEQKGDEELVLRFFAVKNFLDGYHGNVQEWLDLYMEQVLFKKSNFDEKKERGSFEDIFEVLNDKFGRDAFARHRDGQAQGRLAPAYFEAVVGGALRNLDDIRDIPKRTLQKALAALFESEEFREVTGPGANTIDKLNRRIELVSECFRAKKRR